MDVTVTRRASMLALVFVMSCVGANSVYGQSALFIVDFEGLPELTEISDQYAADQGVTFSIQDHPDERPIICVEGAPRTGFGGAGTDAPMSSGIAGLTDPVIDGDEFVGRNIVMDFDPPVSGIRLFVIDLENGEFATLRAFDGAAEVDSMTVVGGDPNTGNGVSTVFDVNGKNITSAVLEVPLEVDAGWAMDFLVLSRPCEGGACGPQIRLAQESAPGAGDFDDNILGDLQAWPFTGNAEAFFAYGVPEGSSWNGPWMTPQPDRSHLLFANTDEGVSLFVVHDRAIPDDPDGGRAETMYEVLNDEDGAEITVRDDPTSDEYTGEHGDNVFTATHSWLTCCTDGLALSGLACQSSTFMQFADVDGNGGNAVIEGMTEWVAYSADGTQIPLVLEEGRRVRVDVIPAVGCPADLNCDGVVDVSDLLSVLAAWGQSDVPEDINDSGVVDVEDLLLLLALWGPCV